MANGPTQMAASPGAAACAWGRNIAALKSQGRPAFWRASDLFGSAVQRARSRQWRAGLGRI